MKLNSAGRSRNQNTCHLIRNGTVCVHEHKNELHNYHGRCIYTCDTCGLIFADSLIAGLDPTSTYANFYKHGSGARFNFGLEAVIRLFRFWRAFKIFTINPRATKMLDIGSGRGFTLYYLKKYYGYARAVGTQISKNAYEFSRTKLGLEIYNGDLLGLRLEDKSFDIITMWHVLEHVLKPEEYVKRISELLSDNGMVLIEVPNFDSWTRKITGEYWLGLDLEHHVTFFTPDTLVSLLEKYGFKIRKIHTFSLEYSAFISAQSIVSVVTESDQLFFNYTQTGDRAKVRISHIALLALLVPICLVINILLFFSKRGEVLLVVAEKTCNAQRMGGQ
ncbi:MAG: class I SAM-dependent methyltransferase [Chlamydiota bacterium]